MRVEQEQRVTEDARISAEQDAAAQRYAVHVLQVLSIFDVSWLSEILVDLHGNIFYRYIYMGKSHLSHSN